jgi:hypothetical protein
MIAVDRRSSLPRKFAAALSFACALAAAPVSAQTDYTDIWWNPLESGWGVNLVQASDFIFATFFVYGPTGQPVWYTGELTGSANGAWVGPLYVSTGTYFGANWNATEHSTRQVGIATFVPTSDVSGTLTYSVEGINVSKDIVRQTLRTIPLGGSYQGSVFTHVSGCSNAAQNGTFSRYASVNVTQTSLGIMTLDFGIENGATCTIRGNATQFGLTYQIQNATYSCGTGGLILVTGLRATSQGIEGQWQGPIGGGCTESGSFTGTLQ